MTARIRSRGKAAEVQFAWGESKNSTDNSVEKSSKRSLFVNLTDRLSLKPTGANQLELASWSTVPLVHVLIQKPENVDSCFLFLPQMRHLGAMLIARAVTAT